MIIANFLNSSEVTTDRLFQWDIGQELKILNLETTITPAIHFCNKKSDNALVVTSTSSDSGYIASIPNSLLAEGYDITAFIYIGDNDSAKTIKVIHIPLTKRVKPSSYVYVEDKDIVDFVTISNEIKSLLDGLIITPYDSTKVYIKPNIVYYNGCTYICKSEDGITGILPTNTDKWGLMCKNGANITEITFGDDTFNFKLDNNETISVPLNATNITTLSDDEIVPRKVILWTGELTVPTDTNGLSISNLDFKSGDTIKIISKPTTNYHVTTEIKYKGNDIEYNDITSISIMSSGVNIRGCAVFVKNTQSIQFCYPMDANIYTSGNEFNNFSDFKILEISKIIE